MNRRQIIAGAIGLVATHAIAGGSVAQGDGTGGPDELKLPNTGAGPCAIDQSIINVELWTEFLEQRPSEVYITYFRDSKGVLTEQFMWLEDGILRAEYRRFDTAE